jgi:NAD(P)-dependent dehydrogenase (short-subunit alcohol dehydrogenase family)
MQLLEGKVALITGAARGQGRSHAVRLATEGATVIGVDICAQPEHVAIPGATRDDMHETEALVRKAGRRFVAHVGDVGDFTFLRSVVDQAISEFGPWTSCARMPECGPSVPMRRRCQMPSVQVSGGPPSRRI